MQSHPTASQQELKTVYIDGFHKFLTPEVLYITLKGYGVKTIQFNKLQKSANVEFQSEALAKEAILNLYGKPLLKKPIRMSLKCDKAIITKFSLQGLEKVDLNKLYRVACKYGRSCKLAFNVSEQNIVANQGYVSFTEFRADREEELKEELLTEGVVCRLKFQAGPQEEFKREQPAEGVVHQPYIKMPRNFVIIEKFAEDSKEVELPKKIQELTETFSSHVKKLCEFEEKEYIVIVGAVVLNDVYQFSATVHFVSREKAVHFFEELQPVASKLFKLKPRVILRGSEDSGNPTNLIALGIGKPSIVPIEDFGNMMTSDFKKIFKGVVQIQLLEIKANPYKSTGDLSDEIVQCQAHITMRSEEDGRALLATYLDSQIKTQIKAYFISKPSIRVFQFAVECKKQVKRQSPKKRKSPPKRENPEKKAKKNKDAQQREEPEK